jgi:hypothetical protein
MSSHELTEWMAYEAIEPFAAERNDQDIAMLAALTANANRDPKKRSQPFELVDFLLFKEKREESADDKAARFAAMFGVTD